MEWKTELLVQGTCRFEYARSVREEEEEEEKKERGYNAGSDPQISFRFLQDDFDLSLMLVANDQWRLFVSLTPDLFS